MGTLHNEILAKSSETPADLATATLEVKAAKLSRARRVTVWVYPITQPITVTLRTALPDAGLGSGQVGNITGAVFQPDLVAVVAAPDVWTPITFDHLMAGDLLVDVIAGADNPTSIEVVVVGSID